MSKSNVICEKCFLHLRIADDRAYFGEFGLERRQRREQEEENRFLVGYQRRVIELVAGCVTNNWPVILTGLCWLCKENCNWFILHLN